MHLLNQPTNNQTLFKANYDKLLHIAGCFVLLVWFNKIISPLWSIFCVFILCFLRSCYNIFQDKNYLRNWYGDWLANIFGTLLWILWYTI
jgi:hypothetical protein